jgi:hypothetical protein
MGKQELDVRNAQFRDRDTFAVSIEFCKRFDGYKVFFLL